MSRRNRGRHRGVDQRVRRHDDAAAGWRPRPASPGRAVRPADGRSTSPVFFVIPLLLVARMSLSNWTLLSGDQGINFPNNFTSLTKNTLFRPAVAFTIEYTVIVTILLIGLGLGLALLVQESGRWHGFLRTSFLLPGAIGLATASLLFWGFYSPTIGPISPPLEALGLIDDPIQFLGRRSAPCCRRRSSIVWKYAGFYMLILLVGLQAIPEEVYEAAAHRRREPRADPPPDHAAAPAAVAGAGADPVHHRLAARLRPVLHPDQGRAGQHDRHRRPADLSRGVPAPEPRAPPRRSRSSCWPCCC